MNNNILVKVDPALVSGFRQKLNELEQLISKYGNIEDHLDCSEALAIDKIKEIHTTVVENMKANRQTLEKTLKCYESGVEALIDADNKAAAIIGKSSATTDSKKLDTKPNGKLQSKDKDTSEWIPLTVIDINGSSDAAKYFRKYEKSFTKLRWNQEKIDMLWQATIDINQRYGIQIDPRLLLAIIIQEGTGSFNTCIKNRAADGQHGVESNYGIDLMKANNLIFGKILGYIYYGDEFREAASKNKELAGINGEGDIFKYCNWNTPIIRMNSNVVETGVYAGHGVWGEKVKEHYTKLGGNPDDYEKYIANTDKSIVEKIVKDQGFKLPDYDFVAAKEAQNSKGVPNGEYIIKGVR